MRRAFYVVALLIAISALTLSNLSTQKVANAQTSYCTSSGGCYDISVENSHYVAQSYYEGSKLADSSGTNCGPASVAMAVSYISNGQKKPSVKAVRSVMATYRADMNNPTEWALASDVKNALDYYGVSYTPLKSYDEIEKAINVDHDIVIALINMDKIGYSEDYRLVNVLDAQTCPDEYKGRCQSEIFPKMYYEGESVYSYMVWNQTRPDILSSGRYNQWRSNHWLILKGEQWRFGPRIITFDPNTFPSPKYYYSDNSAKGLNRAYPGEQVEAGFMNLAFKITGIKPNTFANSQNRIEPTVNDEVSAQSAQVRFLSHVNYGNNNKFMANDIVTKAWHIQNISQVDIGYPYGIEQVDGPLVSTTGPGYFTSFIEPGKETDVYMTLVLPSQPGTYTAHWRFIDSDGNRFGDLLPFTFTVQSSTGSDAILPTASFTSPKNGDELKTTTLAIRANASDNAGGSGIKQVNFSAKWSGDWHSIGSDTTAPYEINYDLCTLKVPKGDIELGLEAIDNAGNKYVYSSNHSNPVVRYVAECKGSGGVPSGYWSKNIWSNEKMEGNAAVNTTYNGFFIEEDWGTGSPYSGINADLFSISYAQNINFQGGRYYFKIRSDDGARVQIDSVNRWGEWYTGHVDSGFDVDLQPGNHTVQIDYFENKVDARIKVWFWGPGISRPDFDPPDGRITSFTNNSFIGQSPITIYADAWDEESGIQSVKFRVYHCQGGCGWRDISTDTSAPYSATWNHSGMEGQQVKFTLDVTDKSGKTKTNAGGEITATIDTTKPSVDIISPIAETSNFEKSFNIAVSASDALSGIQRVKFQAGYPGDENYWHVLGEDTDGSNGWGLLWDGSSLPDGTHVDFYVEVVDNAENIASDVIRAVRIGASVIFYEDAGYGGRSTSFFQKTASDLSYIIDNNASSIKIKPGWSIRVFEGNRIRGGWKCYQSDMSDLSYEIYPNNSVGINDSISSVEVYPRATCPGPADANWDGIIDGIDYTIWHLNYTSTNTMGSSTADYNYDGIVDGIDYTIWHINY